MNAGRMTGRLGGFDRDDEIEVEACFAEAGDSYASASDVSAGPHEPPDEDRGPVVSAGMGFGAMPDADLDSPIDCAKGIDGRLGYCRDGA